ncbi:MAG: hypothetical protein ACLFPJ_06135 [Candidatus Woesearchaeota archaeon]
MRNVINFFRGFKKGMLFFGENIALIVNSFLLLFVYFLGLGLTSIVAKIFKKRFLDKKINLNKKTYWSDLNLSKKEFKSYYRQF